MSTPANDHPFRAHGKVSAEDLLRYARGEGDARERHRIEQHLLADPLLAEAAEGLQQAGAVQGWGQLRATRNGTSRWRMLTWSVAALFVILGLVWFLPSERKSAVQPSTPTSLAGKDEVRLDTMGTALPPAERTVVPEKVSTAVQTVSIPLSEVYARERADDDAVVLPRRNIQAPTGKRSDPAPLEPSRKRSSRQLVFLHDMKLVHPDELYHDKPPTLFGLGVPAPSESAADTARRADDVHTEAEPYLSFFDAVMAHVKQHDDDQALKGLAEVLRQYPEDVNALFYAGYSAYRAGRYERAIDLLHQAAEHPVDTFQEEAEWYEALALLEGRGIEDALPALRKVEEERGFYSERASALMGLLNGTPSGSR